MAGLGRVGLHVLDYLDFVFGRVECDQCLAGFAVQDHAWRGGGARLHAFGVVNHHVALAEFFGKAGHDVGHRQVGSALGQLGPDLQNVFLSNIGFGFDGVVSRRDRAFWWSCLGTTAAKHEQQRENKTLHNDVPQLDIVPPPGLEWEAVPEIKQSCPVSCNINGLC
ncbi:MAG: hypothetical protein HY074_06125 [Deltaproteobacteria bacterium]|nr:hypothetical protein [Deltaproteobacteria bacterium]